MNLGLLLNYLPYIRLNTMQVSINIYISTFASYLPTILCEKEMFVVLFIVKHISSSICII